MDGAGGEWGRRAVAGRSPPMAVGSRGVARGARPSIRLGKAAEGATLRGAERRGCAATGRVSDTLAFVPHDRRGYHPPCRGLLPSARDALPALCRPRGLIDRGADHGRGYSPWRSTPPLAVRVPVRPCRRHGGTREGFNSLRRRRAGRPPAAASGFRAAGRRRRRRASRATRPGGRRAAAGRSTRGLPWRRPRRSVRSRTSG